MQHPHQIIPGGKVYPCHLGKQLESCFPFHLVRTESFSVLKWTEYSQSPGGSGTTDLTHLPSVAPVESAVSDTAITLEAVAEAGLPEKTALMRWSWSSQWF